MTFWWNSDSVDYLTRVLFWARWFLGIVAVITALGTLLNLRLSDRIADLQKQEKVQAQSRLRASEEESRKAGMSAEAAQQQVKELRVRQQPRSISSAQRQQVVTALKLLPTKSQVYVAYFAGDKEAESLAQQISGTLTESGIDNFCGWRSGDPLPPGL